MSRMKIHTIKFLSRIGGIDGDEVVVVELLGIDDGLPAVTRHIGEDLEQGSHPHVVAVAGDAEADATGPFDVVLERLDADEFPNLCIA